MMRQTFYSQVFHKTGNEGTSIYKVGRLPRLI